MLKYVALMEVDVPALWSGIYPMYNSTAQLFRSPIEEDREKVEQWLREQKKQYPNSRVNSTKCDKKYSIQTTIIAFDDKQSKRLEHFLENSSISEI